ncbi:aminopeptidase P family protein [Saccharolobus solfataricus]|uniref:X-pro aminopeptidase n=3 Tax=Saccharolobus solfataricus TaxID=2287 RepID=Q981D7_SACS2|nr:aminopeptidase P family protein [Saccharolobus solfataricus]AAK40375.1 X-pro aminopeptidase [Saccharolobus solfataricus P2]AKA73369.1 aminopeptidase P family protein [Saccharolobus solfataricus]AKA76068.1 aminopeptidase P family protein [Saccharolobus solfataricus]AKA78761.1 aminopeptidase P family protein [Saccharolobus solfataricus]AZF67837.1 aminopeptidase P family protein [Saccharolobus solfataricus]
MNRIQRVQKELERANADYLITGTTSNMYYLIGFSEEQMERPLLLFITRDDYFLLVPKLYEEQLKQFPLIVYRDGEDPYSKLNLKENSNVLIDDTTFSLFTIEILNRFKPGRIGRASRILGKLRQVKDDEELEKMEKGVKKAEQLILEFVSNIKENMTECQIERKLKSFLIEEAGNISFDPIVTSGPNSSMPHLRCSDKKVKRGEAIVIDYGIKHDGYSTDTTRVFSLGKPNDPLILEIVEIVKTANEEAEKHVREGMRAKEIDYFAREVITNKGYGDYFIHRTGHGIGIDVHEDPYISPDNDDVIEQNMVFTIEPGIYLPGKFGIRIEDEVVVKKGYGKTLNMLQKELYII